MQRREEIIVCGAVSKVIFFESINCSRRGQIITVEAPRNATVDGGIVKREIDWEA